jgi:hypothetical protein
MHGTQLTKMKPGKSSVPFVALNSPSGVLMSSLDPATKLHFLLVKESVSLLNHLPATMDPNCRGRYRVLSVQSHSYLEGRVAKFGTKTIHL